MTRTFMVFSAAGPLGRQWLPVARSADVEDAPLAVQLLGASLVLWRSPGGVAIAAPDRCTHSRGTLSNGVVNDGCLVCPKHGWTFGEAGRCVHKPSGLPITEKAHLKTHPCTERYGLIWVCLGAPATSIIDLAWDGDAGYRRIHTDASMWQANPVQIIEALLAQPDSPYADVTAEVPFSVHGVFSSADGAQHRRLVSCAPVDARKTVVTSVVWSSGEARGDDAQIAAEAMADLDAVRSAAEAQGGTSPAAEITPVEDGTGSADWKRRLSSFVDQASA